MSDDINPKTSRRGLWLRLALSLVLAAAFAAALAPYLQAIPDDLSVPAWLLPTYLLTLLPYHLLRAGRWQFLLAPLTPADAPIATSVVMRVGLAGYMWIALLPFRLGELARPLFLAQRSPAVTVSRTLGTIAIERVVDGLLVCALFFVGIVGVPRSDDLDALQLATGGVMAAFAVALAGLLVMALRPRLAARVTQALLGRVSPRLATAVSSVAEGVGEGLRALPSLRPLGLFVVVSAAYWSVNAAGMWLLANGCGLPLSFQQSVVLLAVMNIALIVPGGPAQFGTFQTGVALGLHLFLPGEVVLGAGSKFAFWLYVTQLSTIVALGVWSQQSLKLDWRAVLRLRARAADSGP
jgi:uncharacterized membrane protein YbhN (UPF0104 family)